MNVAVYTESQCVQCDATKRARTSNPISYETVDVTEDRAASDKLSTLGHARGSWSSRARSLERLLTRLPKDFTEQVTLRRVRMLKDV